MSSDFERLLQEARDVLPAPDEQSTERARRRSLATLRPSSTRRRRRVLALAGAMLVTAVALGVTAGSLNAPSVTAARESLVLGFVPEPGWFALQSPPPAIAGQQTAAVASNVPFEPDDVVNGLVEPSGLPYSTLLNLPPDGIVIVMTMVPYSEPHIAPVPVNPIYPERDLPLRIGDGVPYLQWGAQVRPDQPLAQYQLRASLAHHAVDVLVYFGTSRPSAAQMKEAQRQLAGLVVRRQGEPSAKPALASAAAGSAVIDRTYSCTTVLLGGIYKLESRAHAGIRSGSGWAKLPYAVAASGGATGGFQGLPNAPRNSLVWITAGIPTAATRAGAKSYETFPVTAGGTLGLNRALCEPSRVFVPMTSRSLSGGAVEPSGVEFDCAAPKRVFVRFRATTPTRARLGERAQIFLATNAPAREAQLAVRTPAGKLLAYADVSESGKARLFTAKGCIRE